MTSVLGEAKRVRLHCPNCYRDRTVDVASIITDRDGPNTPVEVIRRRLRCSRCNGKHVQIMALSHTIGPPLDERDLRLQTNVDSIPCPECGSQSVSRSAPLRRPIVDRPRFMPGVIYEYDCEDCGNWWTA